ncbi:OsmC family protein [Geotoga petraea]|jgi:putative redox protein|nr:OsmC family protein [Geotoga petraea]MDK2945814.1 putative redox protein [Geotoga sp.]SDC43761.1 putative redox protein [Geotoga petraea]
MKTEMEFKEISKKHFYTKTPTGHDVHTDANIEIGGTDSAPRPMELMLSGLAGCTGVDVSMILEKMKVEYEEFKIKIEADRREEQPRIYTDIKIVYMFKGKDLPMEKLERAVNLSQDKYCAASAIFKGTANVDYEIKIID